ncbi:MAG: hypothetical protein DHS20C18_41250 [Saprospiraceae bacterium]|nr:MAG: hypothetical protein DHS20C18_41250 [Saprospiraceae bacterium]
MKTPAHTQSVFPALLLFTCGLLISVFIWYRFVGPGGEPVVLPGITDHGGKQLELPFEGDNRQIQPDSPEPVPLAKKRFDDTRLGICIIYGLVAPASGEYLIPGCYGKPDRWVNVQEGTILKVGRHWNPAINVCGNIEILINTVLHRRYAYDKKIPMAKISFRDDSRIFKNQIDITIIDCIENVTEGDCENIEKQYIKAHGGAKQLLLNCCCR